MRQCIGSQLIHSSVGQLDRLKLLRITVLLTDDITQELIENLLLFTEARVTIELFQQAESNVEVFERVSLEFFHRSNIDYGNYKISNFGKKEKRDMIL